MAESPDAQTQLKKRARRRLVGAIALAGLAAVVLPMVMDEEPKQQVQDVQIRIPGQDQAPFKPGAPAFKSTQTEMPAAVPESVAAPAKREAVSANKPPASPPKPAEMALPPVRETIAVRPTDKTPEKIAEKKTEKTPEKPVKQPTEEARRAAAILAGKASETAATSTSATYVILLGAFSNAANVKQLESKIGELGIKTFTESLDSSEGKKTRLRAGPFSSRDSADKALDRMKRIGVSGAVAAKQ